jgi:hypothetical protein
MDAEASTKNETKLQHANNKILSSSSGHRLADVQRNCITLSKTRITVNRSKHGNLEIRALLPL